MTLTTDDPTDIETSAAHRVVQIARLFTSIRKSLDQMIVDFGGTDGGPPKQFNFKLSELQSAHVSLIKAEEVFHEKFASTAVTDGINYDAVRGDIGRQLDRIRAAIDTE